ncbi:hypothetical protein IW140_005983 [Coemansia sp. RSA 1813]|nr:hypothetical protein EV178_003101 [Coemansia sp. RSA 1646]KAJ1767294.1 hypothetical protein LPJ74_005444 [Coemansia sp. RSA 1843]KAJ2089445.1 hypothetical protein IW138_003475 [Coemansia sp. RSA 986]KAJ2214919.1 hypothetical protein EV179_002594 [Coemansia sp. RSA 487]KAJ2563810.1 hypothetical protein IW140_005983 [Coemansia sp. RSA 1813]
MAHRDNYTSPMLEARSAYTPVRDDSALRYDSTASLSSSLHPVDLSKDNSTASSQSLVSHIDIDGKRQRVSRACDKCRRKKVKCDGKHPVCSHCEELGYECTYLDATKKRGPPKGYIEAIETRLHKVEELLRGLVASNPDAARYIYDVLQNSASGIDAAVISDTSGVLFGSMAMDDLKAHAVRDNHHNLQQRQQQQQQQQLQLQHLQQRSDQGNQNGREEICADAGVDSYLDPDTDPLHISAPPHDSSSHSATISTAAFPNSQSGDNVPTYNLTHLEKRVGHLTLDPTGSLRYLGDSSGWYIINHNLVSLETSSRLKKGPSGAFRWPPITTIATRESDTADASGASTSSAVATTANIPASATPMTAGSAPSQQKASIATNNNAAGSNKDTARYSINNSSSVVAVPRNPPPCAKPPMPNVDEQINLLSLYFRYVHPVFPILSKTHLLQRAFDRERPLAPAFMSAVFAAASTYKAREAKSKDDLARVRIQMAVHFQRAKLYLDEQYTNNSLFSILTLLLMSVYEQGTMSTRSWLYSGMAIRKAYDMGLHRDMGVAKHNELSVVSKREADIRLRAWWGCYIMDIMVSATLGRPTTIRDFTFDAPFPDNYGDDDDELLVNSSLNEDSSSENTDTRFRESLEQAIRRRAQPQRSQRQADASKVAPDHHSRASHANPNAIPPVAESMRDYVALTIGDPESDASDTEADDARGEGQRASREKAHGVYYLDLLHIFGHVLTEMYTCKPNRDFAVKYCFYSLRSRTERLIALDHELRQWMDSLPAELCYPVDDILAARPARCVYIALIHLVYYTAMILLHRPFISRLGGSHQSTPSCAMPSMDGDQTRDNPADSCHPSRASKSSPLPSHSICTVSAQMISLIGQAIIQDSRIFIMPFLTFMMFTAGTMHLNNVIVAADSWIARRFLKRTLNVMSRLGAHWQVSYKCYTMLNTLVRANKIGLDQLVEDDKTGIRVIKERYRENIRISQIVYEERFSRHAWSSSDLPDPVYSPGSPLRPSTPAHMQSHGERSSPFSSTGDKTRFVAETARDTDVAKSRDATNKSLESRQHTVQTPRTSLLERMDVSENHPYKDGDKPYELDMDPATEKPVNAQNMNRIDNTAAACDGTTSSAVDSSGSTNSLNIYNSSLQHQTSSSDGIMPASYSFTHPQQQRQLQRTDPKIPMFLRIPALRRLADSSGHPIVPASPYTSVTLSGSPEAATTMTMATTNPESAIPASTYITTQGAQQSMWESSMSLGRFVPSLEFFANAEFPLGIGGPNGQASLVLPQAMTAHNTGTNVFGSVSGYSENNNQLAGLGLTTKASEKRPALDGLSFAESSSRPSTLPTGSTGGDSNAMSLDSTTLATAFPVFSDTCSNDRSKYGSLSNVSFVAALPEDNNTAENSYSPGTGNGGGFDLENSGAASNDSTPANMGFSGMLIDDDVIRNLPFSGPVSYDLGLGGIENLSSVLLHGGNSETSANDSAAMDTQRESNPAASPANRPATEKESSEVPWKDYVDQVIRLFDKTASNKK